MAYGKKKSKSLKIGAMGPGSEKYAKVYGDRSNGKVKRGHPMTKYTKKVK